MEFIEDSLWFEAEASFDSALVHLHYLESLDSLSPQFYKYLGVYRDSIYSLLVRITSYYTQMQIPLPWTLYWDMEMEKVTDSQVVVIDSLVRFINPSKYTLPLSLPLNPRTIKAMAVLIGSGRKYFSKWLNRKSRYQYLIKSKLAEQQMPKDLIYLAMIESGFSPKAWSKAKASGIWQFIKSTGQRFWIDRQQR